VKSVKLAGCELILLGTSYNFEARIGVLRIILRTENLNLVSDVMGESVGEPHMSIHPIGADEDLHTASDDHHREQNIQVVSIR
jgi:hypothetical protein